MPFPYFNEATIKKRYPSNLTLKSVQLIHRHGERTSVYETKQVWRKCYLTPHLHAFYQALEIPSTEPVSEHNPLFAFSRVLTDADHNLNSHWAVGKSLLDSSSMTSGECLSGQLTDVGKLSLQHMGSNLRQLYVNALSFLPNTLSNNLDMRIRSTEYARTIESVQYLVNGIYPTQYRKPQVDLPIHIKSDENMVSVSPISVSSKLLRKDEIVI